jgi:hypothetical protein
MFPDVSSYGLGVHCSDQPLIGNDPETGSHGFSGSRHRSGSSERPRSRSRETTPGSFLADYKIHAGLLDRTHERMACARELDRRLDVDRLRRSEDVAGALDALHLAAERYPMSFGKNPHVAKAQAAEQKAESAPDDHARQRAYREAAHLWDRAAEREKPGKQRDAYAESAQRNRQLADGEDEGEELVDRSRLN